ncbi:heterokaryon incompatibility protein-domain-containing protein [Paraphoma chrysanthemicola]|nr:heterokaryon incompatibility protein-domain-containing protein [Paraphoma chrysanthemicola]
MPAGQAGFGMMELVTVQRLEEHTCTHCHDRRRSTSLSTTLEDEKRRAWDGCIYYGLLVTCFEWYSSQVFEGINSIKIGSPWSLAFEHASHRETLECLAVDDKTGKTISLLAKQPAKVLPGRTDHASTFATIKTWLHICNQNHSTCRVPGFGEVDEIIAPIRLLDVRQDRLVLRKSTRPNRYACLSHCWGSGTRIQRTLLENIAEHETVGVYLSHLPKTFRDAVYICRTLDIDFLWIDSLCIIQDSEQDWRVQAAQMADIYEGASITIAASASRDSSQGCFRETHASYVGQRLDGYKGIHVRRQLPRMASRTSTPAVDIESWPLLSRGWCYQEIALSPRIVHFAAQEVIWQCRHEQIHESTETSASTTVSSGHFDIHSRQRFSDPRGIDFTKARWAQAIQDYSQLGLTFQKDKLPAIAAIAKRTQAHLVNDDYLAGLWKQTLLADLLWYTDAPCVARPLLDAHGSKVPTWSWASLSGAVKWASPPPREVPLLRNVEVVASTYITDGPKITGSIKEATIKLRGVLLEMNQVASHDGARQQVNHLSAEQVENIAQGDIATLAEHVHPEQLRVVASSNFWDCQPIPRQESVSHKDEYILPIQAVKYGYRHSGLVLKRIGPEHKYQRVGYVELQHIGEVICERFKDTIESLEEQDATWDSLYRYAQELTKVFETMNTCILELV